MNRAALSLFQPVGSSSSILGSLSRGGVRGLYVHVPFCFHKCHYCDFYSITRQTPERMSRFVELLLVEARLWRDASLAPICPQTVFFGGGTPSLLPAHLMEQLISGLREIFDLTACVEWTVECNPATLDLEYARILRSLGVDRLSFGAQSFDVDELARLERHHSPDQVEQIVELARKAGFARLNLDLIFAIPGQTAKSWDRSLSRAIELGTEHLSCYGLTYEPNTPLGVLKRLGRVQAMDESLELEMLNMARARLRGIGMLPYEISNFALAGRECAHNLTYWHGDNYAGLGPSAASHMNGWRWRNRPHLGEWETALASNSLPAFELECLTPIQRAGELAMLSLRLADGIVYDDFQRRLGIDARELFLEVIDRLTPLGLLVSTERATCLSERGVAVMDSIAAEFLMAATNSPAVAF